MRCRLRSRNIACARTVDGAVERIVDVSRHLAGPFQNHGVGIEDRSHLARERENPSFYPALVNIQLSRKLSWNVGFDTLIVQGSLSLGAILRFLFEDENRCQASSKFGARRNWTGAGEGQSGKLILLVSVWLKVFSWKNGREAEREGFWKIVFLCAICSRIFSCVDSQLGVFRDSVCSNEEVVPIFYKLHWWIP